MADESVELEIELKDGISKPAKRASRALQKLAEDASRTQTRMMRRNFRESTQGHKRYLDRQYKAAKQSAVLSKRAAQIREAEGTAWTKLGGGISTFAGGLGMAAGALAALGAVSAVTVYGAAKLGGALYESAKSAGSLRFALGQLTHTDGRAELENITNLAADLGLNVESTAHSYERLLKMQFTPGAAKTWVKFGADMQALGNSAEEVEGILLAVSQIKSKGRLQAQEMLQLAERGVSSDLVYSAIEQKTGKSRQEVMKLQEAGGIDSEMGMAAIQEALLKKLNTKRAGEAAEGYVKTFAGSMGKADSEMQRVGLNLGAAFERGFSDATAEADRMKKAGFTGIFAQAGAGGFFESMQNSPALAKIGTFVEGLGNAFARLLPHLLAVGEAFVSGFADGAWTETFSEDNVTGFAAILRDDVAPAMRTVGKAIGWTSSLVLALTGGLAYAGVAWTNMWTGIYDTAAGLVTSFSDLGSRVIDGFVGALKGGIQRTKDAVVGWAASVIGGGEEGLEVHSPSKAFYRLGKYSTEGFQDGMDYMTPQLPSADSMVPRSLGTGGGSPISMQIEINVNGTSDAKETARMVRIEFESMLSASFGRFAEGIA